MTNIDKMLRALKAAVGSVLKRSPSTYAAASRLLYRLDRSFRTLSPGTPEVIDEALLAAQRLQPEGVGDYYEFGVFRGYTLWHAEQSARRLGIRESRFWGFDSFRGLPPVTGADVEDREFFEGQFACPRADVLRHLKEHGADLDRIGLVEGFFGDTLTARLKQAHAFRPVGVALVDCDLYSSTRDVMNWLNDLLQDNSIILFDDWKTFGGKEDRGEPRAFHEFLGHGQWQARPFKDFGQHGRGFVMKRAH